MEDRLKHILTLALRPDTADAESQAALAAARRIVKNQGLDDLWKSTTRVETRVETKVKVIYRDRRKPHSREVKMTVPPEYLHTMVEHMFTNSQSLGCELVITSFKAKHKSLTNSTIIEYTIHGENSNLDMHYDKMHSLVNMIKHATGRKNECTSSPRAKVGQKSKLGWFLRLFKRS